jgi:hypothetical protein
MVHVLTRIFNVARTAYVIVMLHHILIIILPFVSRRILELKQILNKCQFIICLPEVCMAAQMGS